MTMLESSEQRPGLLQGLRREGQETEARRDVSHGTTTQAYSLQSTKEAERKASRRARGSSVALATARDRRNERDGRGLIWFILSVLFIWLVSFNQTDQKNKRDQPALALHALRSVDTGGGF